MKAAISAPSTNRSNHTARNICGPARPTARTMAACSSGFASASNNYPRLTNRQALPVPRRLKMDSKLYVGNLPYNVTEDDLRTLFSQAGQIKEIAMIMDRDTRQPKGFGFVEMTTQEEAEKAIKLFNDYEMDGRR